jgi:hypothetical protein
MIIENVKHKWLDVGIIHLCLTNPNLEMVGSLKMLQETESWKICVKAGSGLCKLQ